MAVGVVEAAHLLQPGQADWEVFSPMERLSPMPIQGV
jgi:hypothetical protein